MSSSSTSSSSCVFRASFLKQKEHICCDCGRPRAQHTTAAAQTPLNPPTSTHSSPRATRAQVHSTTPPTASKSMNSAKLSKTPTTTTSPSAAPAASAPTKRAELEMKSYHNNKARGSNDADNGDEDDHEDDAHPASTSTAATPHLTVGVHRLPAGLIGSSSSRASASSASAKKAEVCKAFLWPSMKSHKRGGAARCLNCGHRRDRHLKDSGLTLFAAEDRNRNDEDGEEEEEEQQQTEEIDSEPEGVPIEEGVDSEDLESDEEEEYGELISAEDLADEKFNPDLSFTVNYRQLSRPMNEMTFAEICKEVRQFPDMNEKKFHVWKQMAFMVKSTLMLGGSMEVGACSGRPFREGDRYPLPRTEAKKKQKGVEALLAKYDKVNGNQGIPKFNVRRCLGRSEKKLEAEADFQARMLATYGEDLDARRKEDKIHALKLGLDPHAYHDCMIHRQLIQKMMDKVLTTETSKTESGALPDRPHAAFQRACQWYSCEVARSQFVSAMKHYGARNLLDVISPPYAHIPERVERGLQTTLLLYLNTNYHGWGNKTDRYVLELYGKLMNVGTIKGVGCLTEYLKKRASAVVHYLYQILAISLEANIDGINVQYASDLHMFIGQIGEDGKQTEAGLNQYRFLLSLLVEAIDEALVQIETVKPCDGKCPWDHYEGQDIYTVTK